ncbi:hypothetical protein BDZ89DRAFT_1161294 [Hymenopellis radicata]|nr:hypothetical protein BDZ89DRAFT_1161294 [Hymenopellis radicata]
MACFPDLPLDVVRLLLEEAAWSDRFTTAYNLTLVSKDVRQWIEPILHHTVTLDTPTQLYAFAVTITSRNNPDFFRRTVKVLRIGNLEYFPETGIPLADSMAVVLTACTSIERFAFWVDAPCPMPLPSAMHAHPTHLSLAVPWKELDSFDIFDFLIGMTSPSLTHLHLDFASFISLYTFEDAWSIIFRRCPGLTHLRLSGNALEALGVGDFNEAVDHVVCRLPETLTRLTFSLVSSRARTNGAGIPVQWKSIRDDPRLVFVFPEHHPLHAVDGLDWYEKRDDDFLDWGFLDQCSNRGMADIRCNFLRIAKTTPLASFKYTKMGTDVVTWTRRTPGRTTP